MTEESSKVLDRRRLRSMRMASKKKTSIEEDPSAVAITTATSTGIEASLPENHDSKEGAEETSEAISLKKNKKKKKNTSDGTMDSQKSPGKKSKKKKKDESVTESIKSSASKASSLLPSSSPNKKKKKKKSSSSHKKSKTKYEELDGEEDSDSDTGLVGGRTVGYEAAAEAWRPPKETKGPKASTGAIPSLKSPNPISASKSQSERDDSSHRDIKMATPVDSFSKRGSTSSRFKLGTLSTFGSSSISIDDDEIPFWRKSQRRNSPNSPTPSLEEADTILTNDDDFVKLNRSISKDASKSRKVISPPPLSDDDDDSSDESSSDEESSSEDEEPEWLKKKKMYGQAVGKKVAYEPPPKEPESSVDVEDEKQSEDNEQQSPKKPLPPWANARKALKKTNSTRIFEPSSPIIKEKEHKAEIERKDEQDASKARLPSWAQDFRRPSPKKTGTVDNTKAAAETENSSNSKKEPDKEGDTSTTGLPAWAKRVSLQKTGVTANTKAPEKAATHDNNDKVKKTANQSEQNEDEQQTTQAGLPPWANARKSLKKSGSTRIATAPAPAPAPAPVENTSPQEPENNASDGRPPWAKAKNSLKPSGSRRFLHTAPPEEVTKELEPKKDANEVLSKARSFQSLANRQGSDGVPLWAKKKSTESENSPSVSSLKSDNDKSSLEDTPQLKVEETGQPKSVKERLSLWGKPPRAQSVGNLAPTVAPSTEVDVTTSRRAKLGKSQSDRSVSGSASVASLGSQDSQGTNNSHRNRMTAYLENNKNETSKPPTAPWIKDRDQVSVSTEQSSDNAQRKTKPSVTPRMSNKHGSGPPSRTSSGNLSVKERMKAWGGSNQNSTSRDGDASSIDTGGGLSITDGDNDEEKSTPSIKERMKTWNQTNASKNSAGIPTKVSITKSADNDEAGSKIPRPVSPFVTDENPNTRPDNVASTETDAYGRNKAKTWAAKPSPVPAFAAGRMALKKVKKDIPSSEENDRQDAPKLTRMYSSENLKKVTPPPEKMDHYSLPPSSAGSHESVSSSTDNKNNSEETAKEANESENNSVTSSPFTAKLRKVAPPDASKWKSKKDPLGGSSHGAPVLRKVDKPNPQKWKEMKSADTEVDKSPTANLKKVTPPVEKKWKSPKTEGEEVGKLYSSQHDLLRRVSPPIDDDSKAKDTENISKMEPELDIKDLQSGNKTLIMLISSTSGRHNQKSAQDRALTILKGMEIGPDQMETVDGADPSKKERRDELFDISGVRGNYPQFFLVDGNEKITYMADWEGFESMHEMKILSESMNLASSSKYGGAESLASSKDSFDEFAFEEEEAEATPNQTDGTIVEMNDTPDQKTLPTQGMTPETNATSAEGTENTDADGQGRNESGTPVEDVVSSNDTNFVSVQVSTSDGAEPQELARNDAGEGEVPMEEANVSCGVGESTVEVARSVAEPDSCNEGVMQSVTIDDEEGEVLEQKNVSEEVVATDEVSDAADEEEPASDDYGDEAEVCVEDDNQVSTPAAVNENKKGDEIEVPVKDNVIVNTNDGDEAEEISCDADDIDGGEKLEQEDKSMSNMDDGANDVERVGEGECLQADKAEEVDTSEAEVSEQENEPQPAVLETSVDENQEVDPNESAYGKELGGSEDHLTADSVEDADEQLATTSRIAEESNYTSKEQDDEEQSNYVSDADDQSSAEKEEEQSISEENTSGENSDSSKDSQVAELSRVNTEGEQNSSSSDESIPTAHAEENGGETGEAEERSSDPYAITPKSISPEEQITEEDDAIENREDSNSTDDEDDEVPVNFGGKNEGSVEKSNAELLKILEETGYLSNDSAKKSKALSSFIKGKSLLEV